MTFHFYDHLQTKKIVLKYIYKSFNIFDFLSNFFLQKVILYLKVLFLKNLEKEIENINKALREKEIRF